MFSPRTIRLLATLLVLLLTVGCDQATKHLARKQLASGPTNLPGDYVQLVLSENPGGFLSLGGTLPEFARRALLTAGVSVGLGLLLIYLIRSAKLRGTVFLGLALIWAGGASNLIDRFARNGLVTDFIFVQVGPVHTGVFNVADMAIVAGAILLFAFAGRPPKEAKQGTVARS